MVNWKSKKIQALLTLLIAITGTWVLVSLTSKFPLRLDLTAEGRYSLSPKTIALLDKIDAPVLVEVYLDGALPSGFERLKKATDDLLKEFQYHTNGQLNVKFINPDLISDKRTKNNFFRQLAQKGIPTTPVVYTKDGAKTQKLIAPGALISYKNRERGVLLLNGNKLASAEQTLNQSIENLEYQLSTAFQSFFNSTKSKVGILESALDSAIFTHAKSLLSQKYEVVGLHSFDLNGLDVVIVNKPAQAFKELELYTLDQYIMNGGKLILLIDALKVNMDSVDGNGTLALPNETKLDDLLYKYGIRVNKKLVLDINCGDFPVIVGNMGNQPQVRLLPWPFFPILNNLSKHPITKNIDALYGRFVSTLDTISVKGIKKTPLVSSSQYSRVLSSPIYISINELQKNIDPSSFNAGPQPVCYLLEGEFSSFYRNRILPEGVSKASFRASSSDGKLVVFGDGDLLRNEINPQNNRPYEVGYDPFKKRKYANGEFLLNSIDYMLDEQGLILSRLKEVKVRPLDKVKVDQDKTFWQLVNVAIPIVVIIIFGLVKFFLRNRKYTRFNS